MRTGSPPRLRRPCRHESSLLPANRASAWACRVLLGRMLRRDVLALPSTRASAVRVSSAPPELVGLSTVLVARCSAVFLPMAGGGLVVMHARVKALLLGPVTLAWSSSAEDPRRESKKGRTRFRIPFAGGKTRSSPEAGFFQAGERACEAALSMLTSNVGCPQGLANRWAVSKGFPRRRFPAM